MGSLGIEIFGLEDPPPSFASFARPIFPLRFFFPSYSFPVVPFPPHPAPVIFFIFNVCSPAPFFSWPRRPLSIIVRVNRISVECAEIRSSYESVNTLLLTLALALAPPACRKSRTKGTDRTWASHVPPGGGRPASPPAHLPYRARFCFCWGGGDGRCRPLGPFCFSFCRLPFYFFVFYFWSFVSLRAASLQAEAR